MPYSSRDAPPRLYRVSCGIPDLDGTYSLRPNASTPFWVKEGSQNILENTGSGEGRWVLTEEGKPNRIRSKEVGGYPHRIREWERLTTTTGQLSWMTTNMSVQKIRSQSSSRKRTQPDIYRQVKSIGPINNGVASEVSTRSRSRRVRPREKDNQLVAKTNPEDTHTVKGTGQIIEGPRRLRKYPYEDSPYIPTYLESDTEIRIIDDEGCFFKVHASGSETEGFIHKKHVYVTQPIRYIENTDLIETAMYGSEVYVDNYDVLVDQEVQVRPPAAPKTSLAGRGVVISNLSDGYVKPTRVAKPITIPDNEIYVKSKAGYSFSGRYDRVPSGKLIWMQQTGGTDYALTTTQDGYYIICSNNELHSDPPEALVSSCEPHEGRLPTQMVRWATPSNDGFQEDFKIFIDPTPEDRNIQSSRSKKATADEPTVVITDPLMKGEFSDTYFGSDIYEMDDYETVDYHPATDIPKSYTEVEFERVEPPPPSRIISTPASTHLPAVKTMSSPGRSRRSSPRHSRRKTVLHPSSPVLVKSPVSSRPRNSSANRRSSRSRSRSTRHGTRNRTHSPPPVGATKRAPSPYNSTRPSVGTPARW